MMRVPVIFACALLILASCSHQSDQPASGEAVPVAQAVELFRTGSGDGYRCPIAKSTKGILTISRTGHEDKVLEQIYSAGDEAVFGYTFLAFKTRAGVEEFKFSAQLRYIRKHENGNIREAASGGKNHTFFLDAPISGGSGTMRNPLAVGESFQFRTLRCAESEETIGLSIRFEEIHTPPE